MQLSNGVASEVLRPLPVMAKRRTAISTADIEADRLRVTREATGLTQAQFCRATGIGQQAWNNYERGRVRISLNAAIKVCQAFGFTLDWIYRGDADGVAIRLATKMREIIDRRAREAQAS